MKPVCKILTIAFITIWNLSVYGISPDKDDSLRVEVLLGSKMLEDIQMDVTFINSLNVTSNRHILLSSTNQFYLLGWGGIKAVGKKTTDTISSFAYTPDGFLMVTRNKDLCYIDSLGNLTTLHELPSNGMGITAGKDLMYIYDRVKNKTKHALYTLHKGGIYNELFKVSAPIQSVAEINQLILFSMGNTLFSFNPKNEELKALTALQKDKEINSITVDTTNNRIYFSSDSVVYAVNDSSKVIITNQFGGIIRFFDNGLIVFNPEKKFLIRILGIEEKLQSRIKEMKNETLTNTNIIKMVKAKLSDDLIIDVINSSNVDFNINPDSMIYLSNQNVSSEVIMAMKNAMKNKKK